MVLTARQIKRQVAKEVLEVPGVVGVGVGKSFPSVRVYVERQDVYVPDVIAGYPVEKVVSGKIKALSWIVTTQFNDRHAKTRPMLGGISIAHENVTSGTLGFYANGLIYSNNHVMAASSSYENPSAARGDPILQPGPYYGGRAPDDLAAELWNFVPFTENGVNYVDVAVAKPVVEVSEEIMGIGIPQGYVAAVVGDEVVKSGATSGVNYGVVHDVDASLKIDYGYFEALFDDLIVTDPIGSPGDSGSAVLRNSDKKIVGLLFAGSDAITVHCKIKHVLSFTGGSAAVGEVNWKTVGALGLAGLIGYGLLVGF